MALGQLGMEGIASGLHSPQLNLSPSRLRALYSKEKKELFGFLFFSPLSFFKLDISVHIEHTAAADLVPEQA